jgi:putative spermidine/putrescine transport system permease protein
MKAVLILAALAILIPVAVLAIWSAAGRWAWPDLLPQSFSLRAFADVFAPHSNALPVLFSSIGLSLIVGAASAVIGVMTARALVLYDFPGKKLIAMGSILPIIVPGTAFAMGASVLFIRMGLSDTVAGVVLVHILYALPYTVNIMLDITRRTGDRLERQAQVLGAGPSRAFWHTTLPQLLPGILSAVSMGYIISFSQYFLTLMIGGGKVVTFAVIMLPLVQGGDRSLAAVYALLFLLSSLLVFALFESAIKRAAPFRGEGEIYGTDA